MTDYADLLDALASLSKACAAGDYPPPALLVFDDHRPAMQILMEAHLRYPTLCETGKRIRASDGKVWRETVVSGIKLRWPDPATNIPEDIVTP